MHDPFAGSAGSETGLVIHGGHNRYLVRGPGGDYWCSLRTRLRREAERGHAGGVALLAVGDGVDFAPLRAPEPGLPGEGQVLRVHPRRSRIARRRVVANPRTKAPPQEQVLVANADLLVIVVAAANPRLKPGAIDRLCLLAEAGGVQPLICVNKVDLLDGGGHRGGPGHGRAALEHDLAPFRRAGYSVHLVSAATGEGVDALAGALRGRVSGLVGPSGAGKTSLANRLVPDLAAQTRAVSDKTGKGRHTTSAARLYELPGGGWLADTPGLRAIGFAAQAGAASLADHFPEIAALADGCRFRNCGHTHEPGCAVKEALAAGAIEAESYRRFVRLRR